MCLYAKKLDRGRFIWPQAKDGVVALTMAQFSMLLKLIDWRSPAWTARPTWWSDADVPRRPPDPRQSTSRLYGISQIG